MALTSGYSGELQEYLTADRTLSIPCPPIPTPLAESALNWGLDEDRCLVQKSPWPDTPAPWDMPPDSIRLPTGKAEPLLPPADADDEIPVFPPSATETLPSARFLDATARRATTIQSFEGSIAASRPPSRGFALGRSLTNALRKAPQPFKTTAPRAPSAIEVVPSFEVPSKAQLPKLVIPQPPTPDPRKLNFSADDSHVFARSNSRPPTSRPRPRTAGSSHARGYLKEQRAGVDVAASASVDNAPTPWTPRRIIFFLWKGRRWPREVQRPENYADQLGRIR